MCYTGNMSPLINIYNWLPHKDNNVLLITTFDRYSNRFMKYRLNIGFYFN